MKKRTQKIVELQKELLNWFEVHQRKFPWRTKSMTAYRYIIAETLLQRTKAETVAKFYPRFVSKFPNWESIDSTNQKSVAAFLKPIGLYKQRSARLKKLSREMILLKGKLPKEKNELEKISFFGQYIVNAILLFVFHKPAPLLDVNMSRVLERYFGKRKLADIRYDPYLQKLAHDFVNHQEAKKINWAILDFAALVCKPKPNCENCPVKMNCKYFYSSSDK